MSENNARRKVTDADIEQMAGVEEVGILAPEARQYYEEEAKDGFSFKNLCFESVLELIVARMRELSENLVSLSLKQVKEIVGYDASAPNQKAVCVYRLADLVFKKLAERGLALDVEKLKRAKPEQLKVAIEKLNPVLKPVIAEAMKDEQVYFFPRRWKKVLMKSGALGEPGDFEKDKDTQEDKEYGNFVACEFDDPTLGDQLKLALALGVPFDSDNPEWRVLAACGQQGNRDEHGNWKADSQRSHLYLLQTFSGKSCIRKKNGQVVKGFGGKPKLTTLCLPAESYDGAVKRLSRIQDRKANWNQRVDGSSASSHSMFALALDVINDELVKKIWACRTEEQIKEVISEEFSRFTSEEVSKIKVFAGENLGDKAEGKTRSRDGNDGKPPGLGPFGGKVEPQEWADLRDDDAKRVLPPPYYERWRKNAIFFEEIKPLYREALIRLCGELLKEKRKEFEDPKAYYERFSWEDLRDCDAEKILSREHYEIWRTNGVFVRQMKCLFREVKHESGFVPEKFLCEVMVVLKGRGSHEYHLWLVKMQDTTDGGAVAAPKESREMNMNQTRFWWTFDELFQMPVGGLDAAPRKDRPYPSFLINLSNSIEQFSMAVPAGVEGFKEKLKRSRAGYP